MFKLVPDHLRISSGWVRCGRCSLVFDAALYMLSDAEAEAAEMAARHIAQQQQPRPDPPAPANAAPPPPSPLPPVSPPKPARERPSAVTAEEIARWRAKRSGAALPDANGQRPAPAKPGPPAQTEPKRPAASVEPKRPAPATPVHPVPAEPARSTSVKPERPTSAEQPESEGSPETYVVDLYLDSLGQAEEATPPPAKSAASQKKEKALRIAAKKAGGTKKAEERQEEKDTEVLGADTPAEKAPSFVREAQKRAFWQTPPVRAVLWLLLVLLAATLGLQLALSQRDWLAAAYPDTAPALRLLCNAAGCEIGPYRRLEQMVVESSSFTRAADDGVYQFTVTLRNNAPLQVAMPSFDLTLNDAHNQPVLRRILSPAEMGAPAMLVAGGEFAGAARLALSALPEGAPVVGYRVEAFYP